MSENQIASGDMRAVAKEYIKNMGLKLPDRVMYQFIDIASAFGLNPLKREIYAVGYGDNYNIITGYEVYIKRAERTGKLNGWQCDCQGSGSEMTATITIYRKDWQYPFKHTVYWNEAAQYQRDGKLKGMWQKMPSHMLRKVAISQGFRLCFPDELGGMPYTNDELGVDDLPKEKSENPIAKEPEVKNENVITVEISDDDTEKTINNILSKHSDKLPEKVLSTINELVAKKEFDECLGRIKAYFEKRGIRI